MTRIAIAICALVAAAAIADTNLWVTVGNGSNQVEVTGLNLAAAPTNILCTVSAPTTNGLLLLAVPVLDTVTTNGFLIDLDGATDSAGYRVSVAIFD